MMGFPLMIFTKKDSLQVTRNFSQHVFVPNNGAVETYCTIVLGFESPVKGLKIYKNEKEYIQFTPTIGRKRKHKN